MNEEVKKTLQSYRNFRDNTREILSDSGVPDNLIEMYLYEPPVYNKLMPEELITLYQEVRTQLILTLDGRGFSQREISKRLGGSTQKTISVFLKKFKGK